MRTLNENTLPADICAYLGKYKEAALLYQKNGAPEKAVELFTSLKKFQEAMEIQKKGKGMAMSPEILLSQAKYEEENGNYKIASDLYV